MVPRLRTLAVTASGNRDVRFLRITQEDLDAMRERERPLGISKSAFEGCSESCALDCSAAESHQTVAAFV